MTARYHLDRTATVGPVLRRFTVKVWLGVEDFAFSRAPEAVVTVLAASRQAAVDSLRNLRPAFVFEGSDAADGDADYMTYHEFRDRFNTR